jgi:GMP reductase
VGTFQIAEAFAQNKMITCIHKHYTVDEWAAWGNSHRDVLPFVAVSSGTSHEDFEKTNAILAQVDVPFICLDVANGYSEHVIAFLYL